MDNYKIDLVLITTSGSEVSLGMRCLASYLESKNFSVRLVFCPGNRMESSFKNDLLDQLKGLISGARFVGFSVMTLDLSYTIKLTEYLRDIKSAPIIWGGVHPSLSPEESLKYADIVCVGEGEDTMEELLSKSTNGEAISGIESLYLNDSQYGAIKNKLRDLPFCLDDYPSPDFSGGDHWRINNDKFVNIDKSYMKEFFRKNSFIVTESNKTIYTYTAMSSRGCPFKCNYCSNVLFLDKFKGKGKLIRRKSVEAFIKELKSILDKYSYINFFNIYDDDFIFGRQEYVEEFSAMYKKDIDLPFHCLTSPLSITKEKIKAIVSAGCKTLQIGIQSGSERVNHEIYNRKITNRKICETVNIVNGFKDKVLPRYDFIVDNPYEKKGDKLETLRLVSKIPKPFKLQVFSLVFYPCTVLYNKAKEDDLLTPENLGLIKHMSKFNNLTNVSYYTLILSLSPLINRKLYSFLVSKYIFNLFENKRFSRLFEGLLKVLVAINRKLKLNVYKLVIKDV